MEKAKTKVNNNFNDFGSEIEDTRLTEKSDGTIYRLREAICYSKLIGRELTDEEMKRFIV